MNLRRKHLGSRLVRLNRIRRTECVHGAWRLDHLGQVHHGLRGHGSHRSVGIAAILQGCGCSFVVLAALGTIGTIPAAAAVATATGALLRFTSTVGIRGPSQSGLGGHDRRKRGIRAAGWRRARFARRTGFSRLTGLARRLTFALGLAFTRLARRLSFARLARRTWLARRTRLAGRLSFTRGLPVAAGTGRTLLGARLLGLARRTRRPRLAACSTVVPRLAFALVAPAIATAVASVTTSVAIAFTPALAAIPALACFASRVAGFTRLVGAWGRSGNGRLGPEPSQHLVEPALG